MSQDEILKSLEKMTAHIETLNARIGELERSKAAYKSVPDTNLISDSFVARALAVFGYDLVGKLIIAVPVLVLAFLIALASGGL